MVKNSLHYHQKSKAFTLIELIFAIVIISIVFLALPSLSTTNTDAIETSINQEAIFAASAELSKVLTFRWDENSKIMDPISGSLSSENVIDINTSNVLKRSRRGHIITAPLSQNHRVFHGVVTDVNTTHHNNDILSRADSRLLFTTAISSNNAKGYKKNSDITVRVNYFNDTIINNYAFTSSAAATTPSNMKMVEVMIDIPDSTNTKDGKADVVLRSYAANIGEVSLFAWN